MQDADNLMGRFARLPDGQRVVIESQDGVTATLVVRRVDGLRADTLAICAASKIELLENEGNKQKD